MAGRAFVLAAWNSDKSSVISIAVSANREKLERLAERLRLLPLPDVTVVEAASLDEDAEEFAVTKLQRAHDVALAASGEVEEFGELLEAAGYDEWKFLRLRKEALKKPVH